MTPTLPTPAVLGMLVLALFGAPAHAQEAPTAAGGSASTTQVKLEELASQTARASQRAEEWAASAAEFERARNQAPAELRAIEAELAELQQPADSPVRADATPGQLEVLLLGAEQDLELTRQNVTELRTESDRRAQRRRELPDLLAAAKARLVALEQEPVLAGEEAGLLAARQQLAEQRRRAIEAEARSHEQELLSYEARGELLGKRIEREALRLARAERRVEALREALGEVWLRQAERETQRALESLDDVRSLPAEVQEAVRRLVQENVELAQRRSGEQGLLAAIEEVSQKLLRADRRVNEIEADFERLTRKFEVGGLSGSVGLLLRNTRSQMPDIGMYRRFIRLRQQEIAAVQERQDELRKQLADLTDVDALVQRAMQRFSAAPAAERAQLEAVLRDLLETKRKHLSALLSDHEVYFQKLVDFDARQQQLVQKTEALLRFIDQQILWIPSSSALRLRVVAEGLEALQWLATPRHWLQLGRAALADLRRAPLSNFCAVLMAAIAVALVRRIRPRLPDLAARARSSNCVAIAPTLSAFGITLLLAVWGPLALGYVGWRLGLSPEANQFVRSLGHGLLSAALIWASLELPRQLLRRDGVADAHFGWPAAAVATLRRHVGWIGTLAVPLVFVIQSFEMRGDEDSRESLGRLAFIALMAVLTVFTHRMLREAGPLRAILDARREIRIEAWLWRLLYAAGLAVPLGLAAAAARGYYWTALELGASYHVTLLFLLLLLVAFELSLRWMLMARRRLALAKLNEAREAARAAREQAEKGGEAPVVPQQELDLATVDAQTTRLLSGLALAVLLLGMWFVWSDLVPALGILERVELWNTSETITVETKKADGTREFVSEERAVPITLAHLLRALLYAFMAAVLVRNLPGLLEISVFRRLGTAPGERYAYATIAKYAIVLIGGVVAAAAIGINWSNVQWMVAAVGLGLGFGLQEIFANFVSGLILLFERPMRVGDTVTVGDVSGTVSKIRIRATWITGFDRKELVVPNKEFVTNRLINWSLSDKMLRVDIRVGIAYGSDTELAMRELLAVADANEHVLREPKPQAFFLGFGDNALEFELRAFSPDVERRLVIVHQLHLAVDRAFRKAGIEIAFPQRDLHLRSLPPGWRPPDGREAPEPDAEEPEGAKD